MKVKKEYIFLVIVIVVLSLYLVFRNKDKTHYKLPVLEAVEKTAVTRLVISRADSATILRRQDDRWVIEPQGYPADQGTIDKMLDAVSGFTITTLVSESRNYSPYELTDDKMIGIEAYGGDALLAKFDIGKAASTYRHTYVRIGNDPKVYQSKDNIRRTFDVEKDRLRDRQALKIDRETITEIVIADAEDTLAIVKNVTSPVPNPGDTVPVEPKPPWQTIDGREIDEKEMNRIISRLVDLKCDSYLEGRTKEELADPIFTITIKAAETAALSIFEKEDNKYPAVSSQNDYPFLMPEWTVNQIMKKPVDLVAAGKDGK